MPKDRARVVLGCPCPRAEGRRVSRARQAGAVASSLAREGLLGKCVMSRCLHEVEGKQVRPVSDAPAPLAGAIRVFPSRPRRRCADPPLYKSRLPPSCFGPWQPAIYGTDSRVHPCTSRPGSTSPTSTVKQKLVTDIRPAEGSGARFPVIPDDEPAPGSGAMFSGPALMHSRST